MKIITEFNKKSFSEYPEEAKNSDFFIYKYFTQFAVSKKDYHFIPKKFLEDPYFIFDCLKLNPDIYLLADKVQNDDFFNYLKEQHPNSFLKYASDTKLKDDSFCKQAIRKNPYNYEFLPKNLKEDKTLIYELFKNLYYPEKLAKIIPKKLFEDTEFTYELCISNPRIFYGVHKSITPNEKLYTSLVFKDSTTFQFFDKSFKSNIDFVDNIFKIKTEFEQKYLFEKLRNFNTRDIITELDIKFFNKDFCTKHLDDIIKFHNDFPKNFWDNKVLLSLIYDNNIEILKHHKETTVSNYFMKNIPIKEIIQDFKSIKFIGELDQLRDLYKKIVDKHLLTQELNSNTENNQKPKPKSLKI